MLRRSGTTTFSVIWMVFPGNSFKQGFFAALFMGLFYFGVF